MAFPFLSNVLCLLVIQLGPSQSFQRPYDLTRNVLASNRNLITSSNKRPNHHDNSPPPLTTQFAGLGDLWAGITQSPPTSMEPPPALLSGTSIDPTNVNLVRCYKASEDGWSAIDFHRCVDGCGSAVVVALSTQSNRRFGGFNPYGWMSTDDYSSSNAAFLWCETSKTTFEKVPVLKGGAASVFDYATGGPCFGSADLQIGPPEAAVMGGFAGPDTEDLSSGAGNLKRGKASLGGAYEGAPKGWPCRGSFQLVEVEVYCNEKVLQSAKGQNKGFTLWPF